MRVVRRCTQRAQVGPYFVFSVEDTRSGIPPDLLPKIFDPFFTTKERGQGTGLGLATACAILKGHQGFVEVSSELGKGTRFSIYLPAPSGESGEGQGGAEAPALGEGGGHLGSGR